MYISRILFHEVHIECHMYLEGAWYVFLHIFNMYVYVWAGESVSVTCMYYILYILCILSHLFHVLVYMFCYTWHRSFADNQYIIFGPKIADLELV